MPRFFADLHNHPSLYSFNRMRNNPDEDDPSKFHPWHPQPESLNDLAKSKRAGGYSQADVAKLTRGRCRLTFASITPIEAGFFRPTENIRSSFAAELTKLVTGAKAVAVGKNLIEGTTRDALFELTGILRNEGPVRRLLQNQILRYGRKRMQHLFSDELDYWDEFLREYSFWCEKNGERVSTETTLLGDVEGCYHLIGDEATLRDVIEDDAAGELAILLTIEGGHTFTMGPGDVRVDDETIFARIDHLKSLPHSIFFITIAHHFDNGFCGHAHSMPDAAALIGDQTHRMHEGFETERDLGREITRKLLSLDEDLKDTGERRILIDCKHLSAQTRKEYYAEIIRPANALLAEGEPKLPVIFSHASYSGVRTLDQFIRDQHLEDDNWNVGGYYAWSLHCCDEDIRMVFETDGLFGLCFDQRVCGVRNNQVVHAEHWPKIMLHQILGVVDVIMTDDTIPEDQKAKIWDCVCIGTDHDGMIDPVSAYPTAIELDHFAADLAKELEAIQHTRKIAEVGVDAIIEKIAWQNAWRLTLDHIGPATR